MTLATISVEPALLQACASEPIRTPGSIQPHGVLVTIDPTTKKILQVSDNCSALFDVEPEKILSEGLVTALGEPGASELLADISDSTLTSMQVYLRTVQSRGGLFHAIAHVYDQVIFVEFEPTTNRSSYLFAEMYATVNSFASRLSGLHSPIEVAEVAAAQIRGLCGFDRVLVYQFDDHWNGTVIAESRNDALPSYLDLRFPASDIPSQARELYRLNPTRIIPDAHYAPSEMHPATNPKTGKTLDMTFCGLRSISPVHREYMKNMGTAASMSISITQHDRLWGLISCHNREPKRLEFDAREACKFMGQVVSLQTEVQERNLLFAERVRYKSLESDLLAHMAHEQNFAAGLAATPKLLDFGDAEGAAIVHAGHCHMVGQTPRDNEVQTLIDWLGSRAQREDVFSTDELRTLLPEARNFSSNVSGLLSIRISRLHDSYVLWFRPEVVQTVRWGGDPNKPEGATTLHPRNSFELWRETVRDRSLPFTPAQLEAAQQLRSAVVEIVLRRAEEMAELSAQLTRTNKELEAFSYSVSHDLRAPFRHITGYAELLRERELQNLSDEGRRYLANISDSAKFAGELVDHLLNFSRIGKASLTMMQVSLNQIVSDVRRSLSAETKDRKVEWKIGTLPTVVADPVFLRLALFNLLSNSLKYTGGRDPAIIEISSENQPTETVISIRDNGVGFDMRYVEKLFGVFQRLHRIEDFEGTGIGLAIVRRIIERHGGRTWAEGEINHGATFHFSLPKDGRARDASEPNGT